MDQKGYEWKVTTIGICELQSTLNYLDWEGWEIFSVAPCGDLRDRPTAFERVAESTALVVARKPRAKG